MKKKSNLDPVYSLALENADLKNVDLMPIIEILSPDQAKRMVMYILGIISAHPATHTKSTIALDAELVKYNWLEDQLEYTYTSINTRYFPTQEEADNYAKTGNYDYNTSTYSDRLAAEKNYAYKAQYADHSSRGYATMDSWEEKAVEDSEVVIA